MESSRGIAELSLAERKTASWLAILFAAVIAVFEVGYAFVSKVLAVGGLR
jgi:hypothetical protein